VTISSRPEILLAYPSCFHYPGHADQVDIRTSQLLLASYLSQFFPVTYADFEVTIGRPSTPAQIRRYERQVRHYLTDHECDILALSCWTSLSYRATLTTARIFRELYPDRLIVVGGYHPTALPMEFITRDNLIDYVVCGEGELALKEIADGWSTAGRPGETKILKAATFPEQSFVDYRWELTDDLVREHYPEGLLNVFIYLSRGCPFGCSFCMEPLKDRKWRAFSPEESIRILVDSVRRYDSHAVGISDACFGMRPAWRKEFLKRLVDIEPDFWVVFETRPEYLDADDIGMLARLKTEVQFGIESGSPEMLRLMKKSKQPEKFLERFAEVSNLMSDNGVLHRANLIMNHPGETRKTLQETFAYMDRLNGRRDSCLMWACSGYMHFPGCELDSNRAYYEQAFGTKIGSPRWWQEDEDQYEACHRSIPSDDFTEDDVNLWERMFDDRQDQLKDCLAPHAFEFAARKYYWEWKDDARFVQA
jgi:radical SAM superfamily enzyme YgiQ (UPF0313 family)